MFQNTGIEVFLKDPAVKSTFRDRGRNIQNCEIIMQYQNSYKIIIECLKSTFQMPEITPNLDVFSEYLLISELEGRQ